MRDVRIWAVLALIVALGVAACGSDPTPTAGPTATPVVIERIVEVEVPVEVEVEVPVEVEVEVPVEVEVEKEVIVEVTPTPGAIQGIIERARAEGVVSLRGFQMASGGNPIAEQAFRGRFGFPVTIEPNFQPVVQASIAMAQEAEAGQLHSDILFGASSPLARTARDGGALQEIDWMTTFGPLFQAGGQERLAGLIEATEADIRDYCLPRDHFAYAFGYNTDRLELADVPKTWEELLDPKFKDQVALQSAGFPLGGLGIANGWGEARTVEFARNLKANGVIIASGGSNGVQQAVSSGEALIGVAGYRGWMTDRERGAPVDLRFPDDVIPYFTSNICPANGDHPDMAALFVAWFAVEARFALRDFPVFFGNLDDETGALGDQLAAQGVDRNAFVTFTNIEEGQARTSIRLAAVAAWTE